jgi:HSP20 family protein
MPKEVAMAKSTSLVPVSSSLAPLREFDELFDRMFDLRRWMKTWPVAAEFEWRPATDVIETDKEIVLKAELPGVKKEDVSVEIEGDTLTIKGERKEEKEEKGKKMHRVERFYGSFMRSFTLPENVDAKAIAAEMKDGVLEVHLPKTAAPERKATKVEVK